MALYFRCLLGNEGLEKCISLLTEGGRRVVGNCHVSPPSIRGLDMKICARDNLNSSDRSTRSTTVMYCKLFYYFILLNYIHFNILMP